MATLEEGLTRGSEKFKSFAKKNIIVFVLILLCIGFAIGNSAFLKAANLINLTTQMAINAMLSVGLTYVIILGGIDISVGAVGALAGVITALVCRMLPAGVSVPLMVTVQIGMGLLVGIIFGSFNGYIIAKLKVVPMCNDDNTDNRFLKPLGRFPTIEEDEAPYRLLCNEYPAAKG